MKSEYFLTWDDYVAINPRLKEFEGVADLDTADEKVYRFIMTALFM